MNESLTIDKIWAKLGKTFMEREIAFERIEELTRENNLLRQQLHKPETENGHERTED